LKVLKIINLTEHILGIFLPVNWRQNPILGANHADARARFFLSLKEKL